MTRPVLSPDDLNPHHATQALRALEALCALSLPLLALTTALWLRGVTLDDWTAQQAGAEALSVLSGAVALALLWQAARASRERDLGRVAARVGGAGWVLLAGQGLNLLWTLVSSAPGDAGSLLLALPFWLLLPLGLLPGLGLIAFALVLREAFDLQREEELTV